MTMEKVKFETKEEFLNYCKENEICNISRRFLSQWTDFTDGVERKTWFDNGNSIYAEPKSYPCIFVWNESDNVISGMFIYRDDFK
jgi:hypothetical protein